MEAFALGLFLISVTFLIVKFVRGKLKHHRLKIPYPQTFPFGLEIVYPILKLGACNDEERFALMVHYCQLFPDMMKIWFGPTMMIFVNKPDRIQKVLLTPKCLEKWDLFYQLLNRPNSLTAMSINGKWKEHRKFFNTSFSLKFLESFGSTFAKYSEKLCDELAKEKNNVEFDLLEPSKKISFDILCATTLGLHLKKSWKERDYDKLFSAYEITEEAITKKFRFPFLYPNTIYKLTSLCRKERASLKILHEFLYDSFLQRRKEILEVQQCNNNNDDGLETQNTMIDHIVLNEEKFTKEEILDQLLNFIAGYEIWANALCHAMLLLAMHPEIQEKLFEEIKRAADSLPNTEDVELIKNIEYLDMVQKETYRLMPTVPTVLRQTMEDFEIEPGLIIPKETNLLINFYALHRRKDVWGDNANQFVPERFSQENSKDRPSSSYLPFSAGSRICIAYRYSNISLKIAMMKLVQRFTFKTSMKMEDMRVKSYISLKLCTPHLISVQAREK